MNPARILVLSTGPDDLLREICAGMEEEGVPFEVLPGPPVSAPELAFRAAQRSPLEVGIGLDAGGLIVVHHSKLPCTKCVSSTDAHTPQAARQAGQDAARVVTGIPLTQKEPA